MNILTKTLLGTLSLLSTITATVLSGEQIGKYHFMTGEDFGEHEALATQLIDTLNQMNVPVLDGTKNELSQCTSKTSNVLGYYSAKHDVMVICTKDVPDWLRFETLVHETVHVIQDARDGLENDTLGQPGRSYISTLYGDLAKKKRRLIRESYPQSQWNVEVEAFYFETKPQVVLNELKTWAF
tara:strand:+ start:412 stop:960 length:549 start_codon:yes stop_codon:yes gene_type:complete